MRCDHKILPNWLWEKYKAVWRCALPSLPEISRRSTLFGLVAGLVSGNTLTPGAEAKKGKKKKKPKPTACCPENTARCTGLPGQCCATGCCLGINQPESGARFCRNTFQVCCSAATGGGACDLDTPFCCPPNFEFPLGYCQSLNVECVSDGAVARTAPGLKIAPRKSN